MTPMGKRTIKLLPSGVPGLDTVLGGGLPEYSFNLIAGGPGAGKTTLAQQIVFSRASLEAPALYFTVLGEPPLKMLRHAQQYTFFDQSKVGGAVRFVNLSAEAMDQNLDSVMKRMLAEVETVHPSLVVVDSFRTVARASTSEAQLQEFVQRLALHLTGWQATTFLVGEYEAGESHSNPVFTIADGILWLAQSVERNASVRQMQVTKMRACATMPGLHTFVISTDGIRTLSPHITEFLADVVVLQRFVELEGKLEKVLAVVKMRSSEHDTAIRRYAIEPAGVVVGEAEHRYRSLLTGVPIVRAEEDAALALPGLTREEAKLLRALRELGEATADELSRAAGLKGTALSQAIERLRQLEYATPVKKQKGVARYRAKV